MKLLFLDFETTGVEPDAVPIQIGAMYCEGPNLDVVWRYEALLESQQAAPRAKHIHASCIEMHRSSGLWGRWLAANWLGEAIPLNDAARAILDRLQGTTADLREVMLAGYSVHVDRAWAQHWMPGLVQPLSHRIIDVSSFRQVCKGLGLEVREQQKAHTALADCEASREELLGYMRMLRCGAGSSAGVALEAISAGTAGMF